MPFTKANDLPDPRAHLIAVELPAPVSGSRLGRSATLTGIAGIDQQRRRKIENAALPRAVTIW